MESVKIKKGYVERKFGEELKDIDIQDYGNIYSESGEFIDFDEDIYNDLINNLIKDSEHYLVMAFSSNWLRQNGYKISSSKKDCFYRNYDCTQTVVGGSIGGKVLELTESHHDCPCGHKTVIIALTEKEYEYINNADFESIETFVYKQMEKIISL